MHFGIYWGITARSLSEQETLCNVQIQAFVCQKALKLRLSPAKPPAADGDNHTLEGEHCPMMGMPRGT